MRPQFPSSAKPTMLLSSCNLPSTQPNITRCVLNGYFDDQSKSVKSRKISTQLRILQFSVLLLKDYSLGRLEDFFVDL